MALNGNSKRPRKSTRQEKKKAEETFKITQVFEAFTSLPRVLRLVCSTDAFLTSAMVVIKPARKTLGFSPDSSPYFLEWA